MRWPGEDAGDQGFVTVWAAMATASLCVVFAALLAMGQGVAARHRAGAAADLAALAAADRAFLGRDAACRAAARVAGAQGTRVVRCAVSGEIADVTTRAGFGPYRPEVRARAGPPGLAVSADPEGRVSPQDPPVRQEDPWVRSERSRGLQYPPGLPGEVR